MIHDFLQMLSESWQDRPAVVILSMVAVAILIFVIIDTHRHRRKHRRRTPEKPHDRTNDRHLH